MYKPISLIAVALILAQAAAQGGDITWTGGNETWFDTGHWNPGRLPSIASNDTVIIQNNGTARIEAPGAETVNANVGGSVTGNGHLHIGPGGTLECASSLYLQSGDAAYHSEVVIAGGTATVGRVQLQMSKGPALVQVTGGVLRVTASGSAVFAGGGGGWTRQGLQTVEVCGDGRMEMTNAASEIELGSGVGTEGHLNLYGNGVLTNAYRMAMGHSATGGLGVLTISNNAVLHMTGTLYIGGDWNDPDVSLCGASGTVRVAGGVLSAQNIYPGYYGTGRLLVEGGKVECADTMIVNYKAGSYGYVQQTGGTVDVSKLYLGYGTTPRVGFYNLSGGVLRTRVATTGFTNVNSVLNLTGGTFSFVRWYTGGPPLVNAGATMSPGLDYAGWSNIQTNYVEASSACKISIDLGGTNQATGSQIGVTNAPGYYDYVLVDNGVTLAGDLRVNIINGFDQTVKATDKFYVMSAGSTIGGAFANVASGERITTPDRHSFLVYYGSNAATTGAGMDPKRITLTGFRRAPKGTVIAVH